MLYNISDFGHRITLKVKTQLMKNSVKSKNFKRKSTINSESRTTTNFALKTVQYSTKQYTANSQYGGEKQQKK